MKTTEPKQPLTPVPIRECPQCGYKTHILNEDDEFDMIVQDNAEKALEIDDMKQQVAALRVDAERYRFIQNNPTWIGYDSDYRPDEIDAAIDAAMGEKADAIRGLA